VTFVLGYDESAAAQDALETAIDLARRYDESLVIAYGVTPPGATVGEEFRAHEQALEEIGREVTATALERASAAGVEAVVELVKDRPAEALVEVADRHDARMIVVGSHGESVLRAAIMGSTTYRLLHISARPVLVVR
jgi:nucleotide-binding universal stress UspA family protein